MNPPAKILFVDDDPAVLLTVGDRLRLEGHEVITAASGEEGLQVLRSVTPDLIILDISMPGVTGLAFLKKITAENGRPRYPVLVFTARSNMEKFFTETSVEGFLAKTSEPSRLLSEIERIIDKTRRASRMEPEAVRSRRRLLILEDEPQLSARLRSFFHAAGYDVTAIPSGTMLLDEILARKPDAVLIKEILPNTNGHAMASLLADSPASRDIPLIVYDGSGVLRGDAKFANVDRIVPGNKPADLLKAVSGLLGTAPSASPPR